MLRAAMLLIILSLPQLVRAENTNPPEGKAAQGDAADVQDLLLLGPLQPIRLRLRIELEGVPFRTAWRSAFDRWFAAI